jgi:multidrug efflux pump
VQAALQRNNYLAAVGQTKGDIQINLLANTDLRSVEEFENLDRRRAERRRRAALSDVARVELGAEEATIWSRSTTRTRASTSASGRCGTNEIEVAQQLRAEMERIGRRCRRTSTCDGVRRGGFMQDALTEITKTLAETMADRRAGRVPVHGLGAHRDRAAGRDAGLAHRCGDRDARAFGFSLNLLTILAIVLSVGLVVDDAIVVVENIERHVRMGKTRVEAALAGARELVGPVIAMTITLAAVYTPIGFQGGLTGSLFLEFAITLAAAVVVSGLVALTLSPVMSSRFVHPHGREEAG